KVVRFPELLPIFLNTPDDNDILVTPNSNGTTFFNWSSMKSPVSYRLKLGLLDVNAGVDSFTYLPQGSIDSLFKLHNKSFGDSLKTTWFVRTTNQTGSLNSDTHRIVLVRRLLPDSFSLFYPSNKERFVVSKSSTDSLVFKWRSAIRGNYELQFLNNSGNIIFKKESNSSGKDTTLTMSSSTLDSIVAANGINRGDSLSIIWTVFVSNNVDTIEARQRYQATLVRKPKPNVFNLLQPANNTAYLPFQSVTDSVVFKWSSTRGQYTLYLYNITNQVLRGSLSKNNGIDTTLVLKRSTLDSLANLQNTSSADSVYLKWNVIARDLYDTLESSDKYNLIFIRSNSSFTQTVKNSDVRFCLTPNPTTSVVHVSIQESEGLYIVFDMFGRMLFQEKFKDGFDVDMSNFSHGFYTLILTTNKGEVMKTRFKKI
ncbi:MAG: T9SS C-terminal target domain-containing protein, partial [Bacteroidetes bacterium]